MLRNHNISKLIRRLKILPRKHSSSFKLLRTQLGFLRGPVWRDPLDSVLDNSHDSPCQVLENFTHSQATVQTRIEAWAGSDNTYYVGDCCSYLSRIFTPGPEVVVMKTLWVTYSSEFLPFSKLQLYLLLLLRSSLISLMRKKRNSTCRKFWRVSIGLRHT